MTRRQRVLKLLALWATLFGLAAQANPGTQPEQSFDAFKARHTPSDVLLLDRHQQPIGARRVDTQARRLPWVTLDDISPAMVEALLAAEDKRFFDHGGVDWAAVVAVMWQQWGPSAGTAKPRGASTLSMQVAALRDPSLARSGAPRGVAEKWQQIEAARALEAQWSKRQILEAYLNTVSFRGELQGLPAASRALFNKAPSGLDKQDSALLAALIRAPGAAPRVVARRACAILAITRGEQVPCPAALLSETLAQARLNPQAAPALAPHTARQLLQRERLEVSTLDAGVQQAAREALNEQLASLRANGVEDGAVVVLHNRSGHVLAHVGSSGAFSSAAQVDAAQALRQAGSTLKPFLFALAFDRQLLTPASVLDDSPLALPTQAGLYTPQNYNRQFSGPVSVRRALAGSLNIPAVRALTQTGVAPFHHSLQRLGFSTLKPDPQHYGYSLALGSADVSLLALTNAYRTLANAGLASPVRWRLEEATVAPTRVFSPASSWLVGHILADNTARADTFGFDSVLATPFWSAVKTGTSKDMRDNWCIGYSQHYTVGVWVGNASGAAMHHVSGVSGAAPAWAQLMQSLHRHQASQAPAPPAGIKAQAIAFENSLEAARTEWFLAATAPPPDAPRQAHTVRLAHAAGPARITAPLNGALIAWDPDIPAALQKLVARHSGGKPALPTDGEGAAAPQWQLNGQDLGGDPVLYLPLAPGRHRLALLTARGERLHEVQFEVRGMPTATTAQAATHPP